MNRFFSDLKKYFKYIIYATKSNLKSEVANSYLNWIWWILDPLCFMVVYTFVVKCVFKSSEPNYPVFVLIGLTAWNFFSACLNSSVKLVSSNKAIVSKVYIPKYILVFVRMFTLLFKMCISFALNIVFMIIFKVPFTFYSLQVIPVLLVLLLLVFGISTIFMHFGVFVEDLGNLINIFLRLVFYFSGVFYSIPLRIDSLLGRILVNVNPIALIIDSFRKALLYEKLINFRMLGIWFVIGIILSIVGIKIIQRYENSYVKVIK